jgi:TPR repeat protein
VKEDYERAAFWYRRAAEKGNSSAMFNLGRMYERGRGVGQDIAKAKELYQKAAAKGNSDARARLDQLTDK